MRYVTCGFLDGHNVMVDTLTGEATLLDDTEGNLTLTYINIINPIDHSKDDVCKKLANSWSVRGVIMSSNYFVKLTDTEALYFTPGDMSVPFFTTKYGLERLVE